MSALGDKVTDEAYKKVSVLHELYIEFFATFIPGLIFLTGLIFAGYVVVYFVFYSSHKLLTLFDWLSYPSWFYIFVYFVTSYFAGAILYRKNPNRLDTVSACYQWDTESSEGREKSAVRFCENEELFDPEQIKQFLPNIRPARKKSWIKRLKEQIGRLNFSEEYAAGKRGIKAEYPYRHIREYLIHRGMEHLIVFVPWCGRLSAYMDIAQAYGGVTGSDTDSPFQRSKQTINILKERIKYVGVPTFEIGLMKNEGHIRMLTSLWYALKYRLFCIIRKMLRTRVADDPT